MNYADNNGVRIAYQIRGRGEPLVLLMGFGADGNAWESHVARYQDQFTCVLIDNRGVGQSDQPEGPYSTAIMAGDAVAVMEQEGIQRARVAGISMGGAIAQQLAILYPGKVHSLALISTWPKFNRYTQTVYENLKKIRPVCPPDTFMELLQLWIYAPPYYESGRERLRAAQSAAAKARHPQSRKGFEGQLDACIQHDTTARLREITVPTLITVGERDIFTPPAYSEELHHKIRGSQLERFPDGSHVHHWEDLERFNELTLAFFKDT
ncbi:alpha/beta fold hydrolase [Robiginitalea sp. SC105]|uniref:alpha/beta fold hydrolase n=1 Tax=Robiginitalea sp. SC105 TaxID=2762332 RepID=UPI00163A4DB7|nr:alpha/beta hydrolase [Robiginitalea sp. SC105]MBC2839843.1 alpha/beta hydrolase [Robiginitalea sp. SC105]